MEVDPLWKRIAGYAMDWGIALALTAFAFWAFTAWRTPDLPDSAPDWQLKSIDGGTVSLSDYRGKTVVLNFWATWCSPCLMEIPTFVKFSQENPDIPVLGIAMDGSPSKLAGFARNYNISYPILLSNEQVQSDYKVSTLPMTVIVGPDGEVKKAHVGIMLEQQLRWATD